MGALPWLFLFLLCFSQYLLAFSSSSLPSFSSSTRPLCRRDQRSALLQFKLMFIINSSASSYCDNYSGIPSFPKTLSWDGNATDCCNWDGVTCDGSTGHVVGLDLSCSWLYGKIHPNSSLSQLSHLQRLNLAYNDFNGSRISYAFGSFARLTHLNLSNSALSGSIPSEISLLSKLISLDLSSSQESQLRLEPLHFKVLLKNLTQLQELALSRVNISSGLPDSIGYLKSLKFLELTSTSLFGKLPNSIGYLKSLNYLSVGDCKLRGSIPKSLGNLTQIRVLRLRENSFTGEVPSTLSNLKQLTRLGLSFNNFEGRIPVLAELTKLESLSLGYNNFIGGFPLWAVNLKPLRYLQMSSNQLTGPIPFNLSGLQNLQELYLYNNSLSGVIPPSLFTLISLDLSSNHLTGQIPEFQRHLPLESIDLSNNKLHGPIPQSISTLVNLTRLSLASNDLSGVVDLQILNNIKHLNLSHNFLTGIKQLPWEQLDTLDLRSNLLQGPLPIPPPHVRYFLISNNSLSGEIPSLICNASSLEILDLSHNKLSGAVPQCLGNFSSVLSVLNLRSNGFTGTLPLAFAKPNQLRSLDLSGNQFEGPLPTSLANCTSLEILNVGNNKIDDTFPYWLEILPELQVLVVRSNRFHGPINTLTSKFSFSKLRIVDLSYNEFTGHLPWSYFENFQAMKNKAMPSKQSMSVESSYYHDSLVVTKYGIVLEYWGINFTILTVIDFSSNNFSGEIPNVVGKLNFLMVLNFSHNSLTGYIPASLGDLTNLVSLDISSNQLTGKIPIELTSLVVLMVLNLSYNCLDGKIPLIKQFGTFDNWSYVGNSGSCGFPSPPMLQHEEDDSDFDGFTWKIVVIGYGCGMTLGLFLGSLMFLIGRPRFFVKLAERKLPKKVIRLRRTVADTVARRN